MTKLAAIIVLTAITVTASAQDAPTPEKLATLKESYRTAIGRATAPITKTYVTELERLKSEFTKKGDLQSALAVDAEIKALAPSSPPPSEAEAGILKTIEGTTWKEKGATKSANISISSGALYFVGTAGDKRGPYPLVDEGKRVLSFKYSSGQRVALEFNTSRSSFTLSTPKAVYEKVK